MYIYKFFSKPAHCYLFIVNEESSAVPPSYRYSEVKMIDINESLQLQMQQKQIQEVIFSQTKI